MFIETFIYYFWLPSSTVGTTLFCEYKKLYDYFGRGENDVMKELRSIRAQSAN